MCQVATNHLPNMVTMCQAGVSLGGHDAKPGITVYRFANRIPLLFEGGGDVATQVSLLWSLDGGGDVATQATPSACHR